jgi:hypothetical protein
MSENAFGSVLLLSILTVADLILLRKISLRRFGSKVKNSYDQYVMNARQRADEKRVAAEQRAQAMVVPTVYASASGTAAAVATEPVRSRPVKPKTAPRAPIPDSDDLTNWDVPAAPARGQKGGREMVIERIRPDDPLPGEPRVKPVKAEPAEPDVPHFLARRRPAGSKPEALKVREPEPLYRPEPEPLPPQPDGSEVAEREPRERRGEAQFIGGDWQEVRLGDDALTLSEAPEVQPPRVLKTEPQPEPEPPFEPTVTQKKEKRPVIIAPSVKKPKKPEPEPPRPADPDAYNYPPIDLLAAAQPSTVKKPRAVGRHQGQKAGRDAFILRDRREADRHRPRPDGHAL